MADLTHLFSIGEFSRITGISVKTLRFYHEEGLLIPTQVDPQSSYRYYAGTLAERARVISFLRSLEFSIDDIRTLLKEANESAVLDAIEKQKTVIETRIRSLRTTAKALDAFILQERQNQIMSDSINQIVEKTIDPILIAGIRMKGKYSDCGNGFSKIGRAMGRHIAGPAMMLHYDTEYKETDADFEAAMPVKTSKPADGIAIRELPRQRCVCIVHKGPYDTLSRSYETLLTYIKSKGYTCTTPSREVYLKGPGMIFKGNSTNYLTEIQMPIAE